MDLDLRTVRFKYWKSGGDMRLYYREAPRKKGEGGRGNGGEGGEQDRKGEEKTDSNERGDG